MRFGYVTNGLVHHPLGEALTLLADNGYDGVALTLGHIHLEPDALAHARRVRARLESLGMACVVETGAPFALDRRRKHYPSLVSVGHERRVDLLCRAVDVAAELGAPIVSIWSGASELARDEAWERLVESCGRLLERAAHSGVRLAFEPEPGMLVERLADYERLRRDLHDPPGLGLTLDLGHVVCVEPLAVADCVRRSARTLAHVHVEDMRRGVHEHLMFGAGELDLGAALGALRNIAYSGMVAVELSRHAHAAHEAVPAAIAALRAADEAQVAA